MDTSTFHTAFQSLNDMQEWVGKDIGLTDWMTMTQDRINTFAECTGDLQWIHIDPKRAAQESPYKKTIAHGFLVLSLASKICQEAFQIQDAVMGINYGLDKVRFPNATKVDAQLRGRVHLLKWEAIPGGCKYKLQITFELEGETKPACVAEFLALAYNQAIN
ncbi:MAG: MaoC family dehydratase [Bacteroidota bacterium]